jgi:hypothetical protein
MNDAQVGYREENRINVEMRESVHTRGRQQGKTERELLVAPVPRDGK